MDPGHKEGLAVGGLFPLGKSGKASLRKRAEHKRKSRHWVGRRVEGRRYMCCGREGSPAPGQPCGTGGGTEIQEMIPVCKNKWGEQRFRGQGKLPSSGSRTRRELRGTVHEGGCKWTGLGCFEHLSCAQQFARRFKYIISLCFTWLPWQLYKAGGFILVLTVEEMEAQRGVTSVPGTSNDKKVGG